MSKLRFILLAAVLLVLTTACFEIQYDNHVASCDVSNGRIEISLSVSRDSTHTTRDAIPPAFTRACRILHDNYPAGNR